MSINDMAFGEPELGSKSFPAWEMVVNSQFHNLRPIFHARNDFLFGLAWTGRVKNIDCQILNASHNLATASPPINISSGSKTAANHRVTWLMGNEQMAVKDVWGLDAP